MADQGVAGHAVGRYLVFDEIAAGGMASVHFGRMTGAAGFARTVAIKRLHAQFAKEPEFLSMFIDEARLASRIAHPNVVSTIDIVDDHGEMLLVMDYVFGASLSHLCQRVRARGEGVPFGIAVSVMVGALYGLQAAHEARSDAGEPLGVVHRDVSPQNILVGIDGVARVVDFGIAKALGRLQTTREGQVKGKSAYMAPEQIRGLAVDCRTDVYAASVVLWEALTGARLFACEHPLATINAVFEKVVPLASEVRPSVPAEVAAIVARGLARDPDERFPTARAMAIALESAVHAASTREVGDWVKAEAAEILARRSQRAAEIESSSGMGLVSAAAGSAIRLPVVAEGDVLTDASHISDVKPRRRRGGVLALGGTVLVLASLAAVWTVAPRATITHPPPAIPASSAIPSASVGAEPVPSSAEPAPPPAISTADAAATASPRGAGPSSPHAKPVLRLPPAAPRCDPPYSLDPDGTRHWKSGC